MTRQEIFELLEKERRYEEQIFGNYAQNNALGPSSFVIFIKEYADKLIESYTNKWSADLPPWLISCKESIEQGNAPVKVYEDLIKIMALAAAALEAYAEVNIDEWRAEGPKEKWNES